MLSFRGMLHSAVRSKAYLLDGVDLNQRCVEFPPLVDHVRKGHRQ